MIQHRLSSLLLAIPLAAASANLPAQAAKTPALKTSPDFTRPDLTGTSIHLASYHGKLVLLNFWATWCGPCLAEIPRFSAWQQKYGSQGLQVLGVSMDDSAAPVLKVYRKYQLAYPVIMGDEHLGEQYGGIMGLPVTFLIDPEGKVLARYQGEPNLTLLEQQIQRHLPTKHP